MFLRSFTSAESRLVITGRKVYLRPPEFADFPAWARLRSESRNFLTPWEPTWPRDELTKAAFRTRLRCQLQELREGLAYPFFIFSHTDDTLFGGMTMSNVRRGVAQTGTLGYWIGAPYARQGYMTDALLAVCSHAFTELALNRLEAACLPSNISSMRLLRGCGFSEEGRARHYLKINGRWQDHILFARLASD